MITKSFKRSVAFFATLACLFGVMSFVPKFGQSAEARLSTPEAYLTEEEVREPIVITDPTGRVTFTIRQVQDGVEPDKCVVTEENGFDLVDTGSADGVVCLHDRINYQISYNVKASAVPTEVRLRLNSIVENRDGQRISQRSDLTGLNTFAQGGTGYYHTGTLQNSDTLVMNFPATNETASTKVVDLSYTTDSYSLDQVVNVETSFVESNGTQIGAIDKFVNPITVVGTNLWDPQIYNNTETPRFITENGESFYEYDIALYIPLASGGDGLTGYANSAGINQNARIVVDTSAFPAGSVLTPSIPEVSVTGTEAVYQNTNISYNDAIRNISSKGQNIFTVRVPVTALEEGQTYEWNAHISDYDSQMFHTTNNASPIFKPSGFLGQGAEPGLNQPSDFDTLINYKNTQLTQTGVDYPNNDWARVTASVDTTGEGQRYKQMWLDDAGNVSDTEAGTIYIGDKYWAELGSNPYNGSLTDSMYCDAWSNTHQRIDTSRDIITQIRDTDGNWNNVSPTIRYGYTTTGYSNNSTYTSDAIISRCDAPGTVWTAEPNENTNLISVQFDGDYPAGAPGSDAVQRAYVPFETTEEANFATSSAYPLNSLTVSNTFVFQNNDERWDDAAPRDRVLVRAETLNPKVGGMSANTQNAGTTQPITGMGYAESTQYTKNGYESFDTYPVIEYGFDSAYSDIVLNESVYENYDVTITRPDYGPDGLPGTDDDVSGWTFRLEAKDPITMTDTSNRIYLVQLADNAFTGTLPGYIPSGTVLQKSTSYYPDASILEYKDYEPDNARTSTTTVNANSAVSQSKWALEDVDYAGNEIGWGINYASTTGGNVDNAFFYDVLPYDGDSRGTVLNEPLSNVQFNVIRDDVDMSVEVTDEDPRTITRESIQNGTTNFVPLSEADTLSGEITAFVLREDVLEVNAIRFLEVTASTVGSVHGDVVYNNLGQGSAEGYDLPVPQTPNVVTQLVSGNISGTVYFDDDQSGTLDEGEPTRYQNSTIHLVDSDGSVVSTTTTDENGNYSFEDIPEGDYTVIVFERGDNISDGHIQTGQIEYEVSVDMQNPSHTDLNFGFWLDVQPSITIDKRISGYADGASIADGTEVTFEAEVTNTGNTSLSNIVVNDNVLGVFTCPETVLVPNASMICTITTDYRATTVTGGGIPAPIR